MREFSKELAEGSEEGTVYAELCRPYYSSFGAALTVLCRPYYSDLEQAVQANFYVHNSGSVIGPVWRRIYDC